MCFWGIHSGQVPGPLKGMPNEVARATHPVGYWFIETFWFALACAAGYAGIDNLVKRSRGVPQNASPVSHAVPAKQAGPPAVPVRAPQAPLPDGSGAEPRSKSPDGRYIVRVESQEMRMSHWVDTPELTDTATNRTLFHPRDSNWSMDSAVWQSPTQVEMVLRMYPGAHSPIKAIFDCALGTATIGGIDVHDLNDTAKVERVLKQAFASSKASYRPIRF